MINKLKILVQKAVNRFEYRFITRTVRGKYTRNSPYDYLTYSPWFEPWFQEIYQHITHRTVVREDRCYILHQLCNYACNLHGDFADTSLESVKEYLCNFSNIDFHPGNIPDTFKHVSDKQFSFVHIEAVQQFKIGRKRKADNALNQKRRNIFGAKTNCGTASIDVDLYPTTRDCCIFFYPRMTKGGICVCNDYGFLGYKKAAKVAIDEFFENKSETPISLHTG